MLGWIRKRSVHICGEPWTICRVERCEVERHPLKEIDIEVGIMSLSLVLRHEYLRNRKGLSMGNVKMNEQKS
jgi:hypothetical protein